VDLKTALDVIQTRLHRSGTSEMEGAEFRSHVVEAKGQGSRPTKSSNGRSRNETQKQKRVVFELLRVWGKTASWRPPRRGHLSLAASDVKAAKLLHWQDSSVTRAESV
jgi:hypothetical protein